MLTRDSWKANLMIDDKLAAAPFNLDGEALAWVEDAFVRLSLDEKVAQLFILPVFGNDPAALEQLKRLKPGGITRFFGPASAADELRNFRAFREASVVPPFITADLEGSRMSLPFGTPVLNPLGLAAVDDVAATRTVSRIIAEEAHAIGINWSFTPVIDINQAFRSAIVATRSFGSDVGVIERHALAQIDEFQKRGIAATVKHWPGEGYDDRDQHLVTTVNPLSLAEWEATFGRLYRAAIAAGVMAVMSAHIAFPAFVRSLDPDAGIEPYRPASVSKALNLTLLRERLGFNGLIISDATPMGGLSAWSSYDAAMPEIIANGCDVILFPPDPERHMDIVRRAVEDGTIPQARFEEAVMRVLGLKAALGLHKEDSRTDSERLDAIGTKANRVAADAITRRAPTLVKDAQNLLPLDRVKHKRILVFSGGIVHPLGGNALFILPGLLRAEGFEVTTYAPGVAVTREAFDLVLYLFGDETLLTRSHIFIDWMKLAGGSLNVAMARPWHDIPTVMISFGYPYLLYDAPRVPTYINAYSTMDSTQRAVVDALLGYVAWNRNSPVDPFCGLEDARY
jgi:beta-N-acetylhexosaminidase